MRTRAIMIGGGLCTLLVSWDERCSQVGVLALDHRPDGGGCWLLCRSACEPQTSYWFRYVTGEVDQAKPLSVGDRKSTRLNSSHGYISYAVFCLKKKKKTQK